MTSDERARKTGNVAELIALARRTPLTRGAVAELAKKVPADIAGQAAWAALGSAGVNAAMVLAFAAASKGQELASDLARAILPEVSSLDHVGPLVFATEGKPLDLLVGLLDDKTLDLELECLVLLLAADLLAQEEPAPDGAIPKALLTRGRWLARHRLEQESSILLGGAALRLRDRHLSSLAAPHVNRAKRARRTIDEALEKAHLAPLDALTDAEGARVSTGFTVRNDTSVGRNDPCPCGSGKKYKKCHALVESAAVTLSEPPKLDERTLGADQAAQLRPSEIAALDASKLSSKAFHEAFQRVVDVRQWDLAQRMIEVAKARRDLGKDVETASLVLEALHSAYDARAREAAETFYALLPGDIAEHEAFALDCLRAPAELLERIESEAEAALRDEADGARGMLFASALLRWFPALGIYVARGALHEGRPLDSQALLERMEDARDRLLVSPFEAWWDVYEAFFENDEDRRAQKKNDAKRAKMKEDLRRARAASRKTAAELEKLQRRVAELDESLAAPSASSTNAPRQTTAASTELAEERRRLKAKIEDLQRIIGEGQEERRELRRQLAEREEETVTEAVAASKPPKGQDVEEEPEVLHDANAVDVPRATLVPRFSERASKVTAELAADAAEGVLSVVFALAAGKPNAWGGVKQLTKVRGVLSARAGIHHRVLFTVSDPALEILEVLHRRDLEQVVARLS